MDETKKEELSEEQLNDVNGGDISKEKPAENYLTCNNCPSKSECKDPNRGPYFIPPRGCRCY